MREVWPCSYPNHRNEKKNENNECKIDTRPSKNQTHCFGLSLLIIFPNVIKGTGNDFHGNANMTFALIGVNCFENKIGEKVSENVH